ncbi:MAG: CRISPR-associated endonuclease Cas1 [Bacteroidetes bacterium]|nr:MAG: CRISPR-associated endonuclease Cas1 [Bacteroidota bacterium]
MNNIPLFIKNFSCFQLRIRFRATQAVHFTKPWYFEPRFALGNTLKRGAHPYLYDTLFKPKTVVSARKKQINPPNPLVLRVANTQRKAFKKGEYLDIYLTVVTPSPQTITHLCEVLPQLQESEFFTTHQFKFHSISLLDPESHRFRTALSPEKSLLDFQFFSHRLVAWQSHVSIRFLTPTTLKVNELLTQQLPYEVVVNRISKRVYDLSEEVLRVPVGEKYMVAPSPGKCLSQVKLPREDTLRAGKKYSMSGIMGEITYERPYHLVDDYLLTIAHFIHVGNFTQMGNGFCQALAAQSNLFERFLQEIYQTDEITDNDEKEALAHQVKNFLYVPEAYMVVQIPKSDGSFRELNIPHTNDLLLQRLAANILQKRLNPIFLPQNYAYRKGKGAYGAILQVQEWKRRYSDSHYIIRCDIDNFFDSIAINKLIRKVQQAINEPFLLYYIRLWLESGMVNHKNEYELNRLGIPQGSAISPLLANVYMHAFDKFIQEEITPHFVRYADDIILLVPKEESPITILQSLTDHLIFHLHLTLNREFQVCEMADTFSFLGIEFSDKAHLGICKDKIDRLPQKIIYSLDVWPVKPEKITQTIGGLKRYYGRLLRKNDLQELDHLLKQTYIRYFSKQKKPDTRLLEQISREGFISDDHANSVDWQKEIQQEQAQGDIQLVTVKSVTQKLKQQKRQYLKGFADAYELVVTEAGSFIGTSRGKIVVKQHGKVIQKVAAGRIRQISIHSQGVGTSSNLTKVCLKNNIHIIYYNHLGEAYASTQSVNDIKPERMVLQLELSPKRKLLFIHRLAQNKVKNQIKTIKYYRKYHKERALGSALQRQITQMEETLKEQPSSKDLTIEEFKNKTFLWEARCASIYWKAFGLICHYHHLDFEKREHQGTHSLINQMLNYGYAILESKVMQAIYLWQLSPYISYYHSSAQHDPGLCFDLMEQYRSALVDRAILSLLGKKEKVAQNTQGLLDLETRKKIIAKINEKLFATQQHRGKEKSIYEIMQWQTKQYLAFLKGETATPYFFNSIW